MATIIEGVDAPDSFSTPYTIEIGDIFSGSLEGPYDFDGVRIELEQGISYTVAMNGAFDPDQPPSLSYGSESAGFLEGGLLFTTILDFYEFIPTPFGVIDSYTVDVELGIISLTFTPSVTDTFLIVFGHSAENYDFSYQISVSANGAPPPVAPSGTAGADRLTLGAGDDFFDAGGGSDNIRGGAGNDTLLGGSGKDTLFGEAGDDLLDGGSGNDALYGGDGNDTLIGATGNDILHGDDGDDSLSGGAGADTLIGGTGNDTLDGGDGDDVLTGGTGADIFRLLSGRDTVTDFEDGVDRIDVTALNVSDISMLAVIQTVAGTRVVATGGAELFLAGITATDLSNDDFILSEPVIVVPTPGADIFNGTDANDHFAGGSGADLLYGGNGRDTLLGDSGEDTIYGGAQNDLIRGGSGDDQLFGEAGNDVIYGDSGNDKIEGGGGNDYIDGGADNDRLYGGAGHDTLIGEHGNDKLWGDAGDDLLFGGAGKDELYGGIGNDTLSGGLGDDILSGGAGADVFVFEDRMRADVVTDFELGIDQLDFSAFGFTGLAALTLTQIGANAEVRVSDRDYVTLQNINVADLTVDDFIFAPDPGFFVLT